MTEQAAPLIVNKGELARIFRVSLPTVDTWITMQCPIVAGGSNGVAYEFDVGLVRAWREQEERRKAEVDAERQRRIGEAQAELFQGGDRLAPEGVAHIRESLEAERLALIVGQQKRELIARADVVADYAAVFGVIRQSMLGWASTLAKSAGLTPLQQQEAERLARETLINMQGQIKDPDLRPSLDVD